MVMASLVNVGSLCFLVFIAYAVCGQYDHLKSLEEAIDVGTGDEFGKIFEGTGNTASKLLNLFYDKTNIRHEYIDEVFLEAAKVKDIKDLDDIHLDVHNAVDLTNEVIKHFQANPMAGRKDEL